MTLTEYQVRTVLGEVFADRVSIEGLIERMRVAPANPGAVGFTDDELKGSARDSYTLTIAGDESPATHERLIEVGVDPVKLGLEFDVASGVPNEALAPLASALAAADVGYELSHDAEPAV